MTIVYCLVVYIIQSVSGRRSWGLGETRRLESLSSR